MPFINKKEFLKPDGLTVWLTGAAGSGKTLQSLTFPKCLVVTFDPTSLDVIKQPENQKYIDNLVIHVPLNGVPLNKVFQFTEAPGEDSLYGAIALARKLGPLGEKKIETIVLDGFSYAASLKWAQICESQGVVWTEKHTSSKASMDQRGWYDALGSYLDHLILQTLLPLATRDRLNCVITAHAQRESKNSIEGIQNARTPLMQEQAAASKRQVNLDSDLSPQVLGSFRQRIAGLPSAMIYLEDRLEQDAQGKEVVQYYAYCRRTYSKSLDTVVLAKNRFGLGTLKLTNGNLYKTIIKKIADVSESQPVTATQATNATQSEPAGKPAVKAAPTNSK
jgi:hypothetical protein